MQIGLMLHNGPSIGWFMGVSYSSQGINQIPTDNSITILTKVNIFVVTITLKLCVVLKSDLPGHINPWYYQIPIVLYLLLSQISNSLLHILEKYFHI